MAARHGRLSGVSPPVLDRDVLFADQSLRGCQRRYGGRLGFEWVLPTVSPEWQSDEPHVLAFITAGKGNHRIGIDLYCRDGAGPEAATRLRNAIEGMGRSGVAIGASPADFSTAASVDRAATELLGKVKAAVEELRSAFA